MNKRMLRRAILATAIVIIAVINFGNPQRHLADFLWSDDAAPWEQVQPVYYPDKNDPSKVRFAPDKVDSLEACRQAVKEMAAAEGDAENRKGRYECAIGFYADANGDTGAGSGDYRLRMQ